MSQAPIFESVFGVPWETLPPVMQKHYAVRAHSRDRVVVTGTMNIRRGLLIRLLSPVLKLIGALVPYDGTGIPVTVTFYSGPGDSAFHFDRVFNFTDKPPFRFHSRLEAGRDREMIEFMRGGIGWRAVYQANGPRVALQHRGYVWRVGRFLVPVPLTWIIGKGAAEEEALTDDTFKMWMTITHPVFGESYRYEGNFRVTEVTHG